MVETAVKYSEELGFSVIPLKQNKKTYLVSWKKYETERANEKEIRAWWKQYPNALIGIVTGRVSDLTVIDMDTAQGKNSIMSVLPEHYAAPLSVTPRGGMHLFGRYCPKLPTVAGVLPGVDIRSEGGYVVVPPSKINQVHYTWVALRSPFTLDIPKLPDELIELLVQNVQSPSKTILENIDGFLQQGRRDNDLFHIANCLIKGGASPAYVNEVLSRLAKTADPPYPSRDVTLKVRSALDRAIRRERNITSEVEDFVNTTTGVFSIGEISRVLGLGTLDDRKKLSVILSRLAERSVIERTGRVNGQFRRIEKECDELELTLEQAEPVPLKWPFELEKLVNIYPGNITVLAGDPNAGKTAFVLDFIRRNMSEFNIHYFLSEGGVEELNIRLALHEEVKKWTFHAYERGSNFADVIRPNDVNIIDYAEVVDEFWKVADLFVKIHNKLDKGVAIVCIQKSPKQFLGRGASFGLEKPRLYMTIGDNRLTIIKAKNWANKNFNPNKKSCGFKLINGTKFVHDKVWAIAEEPEEKKR